MTLEEAKRKIKELSDIQMELFDKTSDRKIYGEARAYEAGHILDEVDTEPVGIPVLTLTELARELRKIFKFRYLTLDAVDDGDCAYPDVITLWVDEPYYESSDKQFELQWNYDKKSGAIIMIPISSLQIDIDLSEYADENGNIDYSKCIVDVE